MIEQAITISLIIVSIHVCMWDGMIFGFLRRWLDRLFEKMDAEVLTMPLYACVICMGGIWSLILYPALFGFDWKIIPVMLMVIGLNSILSPIINKIRNNEN